MNKRIVLILTTFVLLSATAQSADLLDKFRDYRYAIKQALGLDTASTMYADTTLNQNIRLSVLHVTPITQYRQKEFSIPTTYKQNRYTLDTLVSGIISVEWKKIDSVKSLVYIPRFSWYQMPKKQTTTEDTPYDRRPDYYDYTDSLLFLYPVPIIVGDTIRILAWTKPIDLATDSLELTTIPIEYRDAVLKYATYMTAKSRQHPLTELVYKRDYDEAVAILKIVYGRQSAPQK